MIRFLRECFSPCGKSHTFATELYGFKSVSHPSVKIGGFLYTLSKRSPLTGFRKAKAR